MKRVVLTPKARADLKSIARFARARWGREQAIRYLSMFDDCFHRLGGAPDLGRECSEIRPGYRKLPLGGHVIFYRKIADNRVQIVRILHGRMDVDDHL